MVSHLGIMMTDTLRYDEDRLTECLSGLSATARAAFAAACAERMLSVYRWFHDRTGLGDPVALQQALADLWAVLERPGEPAGGLDSQQDVAEGLVPPEDESWTDKCGYAQNAAAAVAYAIRSRLTGSAQEAVWAARQVYDALDYRITNRDDLDLNMLGVREQVDRDPLVQRELTRRQNDIEILCQIGDTLPGVMARQLRRRAEVDGQTVFDFLMD